jgi:Cft2 family RNA processing exonuclease
MSFDCVPYGLGDQQDGLCMAIDFGDCRILIDCGLADIAPILAADRPPTAVVCSHAHGDHARGLWALRQAYPDLPIYCSEATATLLPLNWLLDMQPGALGLPGLDMDSELDPDRLTATLNCQVLDWRTPTPIAPDIKVSLHPAGHLPGAALIHLAYRPLQERAVSLVYSGDFYLSNIRSVDGLNLESLRDLRPDVAIVEGSYGTTHYPRRRAQENALVTQIDRALGQGQSVLLPAPNLGLGQELLLLLRSHHQFTGQDLDIWVDGPIAAGCDRYLDLLPHLPTAVQNFARHQPLFWDDRIKPRVQRLLGQRPWAQPLSAQRPATRRLPLDAPPGIFVVHPATNWSQFMRLPGAWQILTPGPWPIESIDRHTPILAQQSDRSLRMLQTAWDEGRLTSQRYHLSDHSDATGIVQLIQNLRPQQLIWVHGPQERLQALSQLPELGRYRSHQPQSGETLSIELGDSEPAPAPPAPFLSGEINEGIDQGTITLPRDILRDPRWQTLADTGIVELRWQGKELIIRGLSASDLRRVASEGRNIRRDRCWSCQFYQDQTCLNPRSIFMRTTVSPDHYCAVYQESGIGSRD